MECTACSYLTSEAASHLFVRICSFQQNVAFRPPSHFFCTFVSVVYVKCFDNMSQHCLLHVWNNSLIVHFLAVLSFLKYMQYLIC